MTAQEVMLTILDGGYDEHLDTLRETIRDRSKDLRAKKAKINGLLLTEGDHVLLQGLSPKYLNGTVVEVVEVKKTRVTVKAIEGVTTPKAAAKIGFMGFTSVPLTTVEKLTD